MNPNTDLDVFGKLVFGGDTEILKMDIGMRLEKYCESLLSSENTRFLTCEALLATLPKNEQLEQVTREILKLRYGPNRTPIMNCIGQARLALPERCSAHLEIAQYILETFAPVASKVNIVDTPDLTGTTALAHAISTKPSFDPDFAQLLWENGANINKRNRFGATPAHEICMVWTPNDRAVLSQAQNAFRWFLAHGGDANIADSDGMKPANMVTNFKRGMDTILLEHQSKRQQREEDRKGVCLACGDENKKVMQCSKCRIARYCPPPRKCQLADWPCHKRSCGGKALEEKQTPSSSGG